MKKPLSFYQPTMQIPDTTSGFDISNSLLIENEVFPGFRKPGDAFGDKPLMQNLYDTQKFSQSVEPLKAQKAEEDIRRNQFRGNMLMALGDALRGKDISSGFLQRQELFQQQAEKRIAEANQQNLITNALTIAKEAGATDEQLAIIGRDPAIARSVVQSSFDKPKERRIVKGGDGLNYYADTGERVLPNVTISETSTEGERARTRLLELNSEPELNAQEKSELNLLKTELYGEKDIVPFFDSSGNVLPQIITTWDMIEKPELINSLSKQGYVTTGTGPSGIFKAKTTIGDEISEKWENSTNTLNLINDLATILAEGRNSPTIPGAIGDLINTGIYQFKAAENLLTNYQQQFPKEYSETINYIQNKHGSVLDKISADRGISTSVVMKLAYSLAKQNDPGGRLSDRDIDSAITIIGGSGANVDARLSTLNSLSKSIIKEHNTYLEAKSRQYKGNNIIEQDIKNFSDLPVFYKSTFNPGPEKITEVGKYKIEVIPQ